jgi:TATA-box binding protein (TBP) (component of TFIID and TFIIIB)
MQFENYPISTQTLIISTNIIIDCQAFYDSVECVDCSKRNNGKTRMLVANIDENIPDGSFVFIQYKNNYKGTLFKKVSGKYFLNSVTVIMKTHNKFINLKVSNKGKIQITGCNQTEYAIAILKHLWHHLASTKLWSFQPDHTHFQASIIPVMCNINFSIDFQINRETLNTIVNTQTQHISILEPSDGYVGVNIKIAAKEEPLEQILIDQYSYINKEWVVSKTRFMHYIESLSPKEQKKKMAKCYVNTFLVFYSGKVIMSGGISFINRKKAYEQFMEIIQQNKQSIIAQ